MNKEYMKIMRDSIHETEVTFYFYDNIGMNINQVLLIESVVKEYLEKYPLAVISRVSDYYSIDHKGKMSDYNYFHDDRGIKYEAREDMAKYFYDDNVIGFNQIRMSEMKLDDENVIKKVEEYRKEMESLLAEKQKLLKKAKNAGLSVESVKNILNDNAILSEASKHGIDLNQIDENFYDVTLIRMLEESNFVKRIALHEIGHAIAWGYDVKFDHEIQKMFKTVEAGFEDIDEFIAECFMASELTDVIPLANKVKERICFLAKAWT